MQDGFSSWVGKIPWRRNDNPLQYSCLGTPMDREAWQAVVLGVQSVGVLDIAFEKQKYSWIFIYSVFGNLPTPYHLYVILKIILKFTYNSKNHFKNWDTLLVFCPCWYSPLNFLSSDVHIPSGVECISAFILWNRWRLRGLLGALLLIFLFFSGEFAA